MNFVLLLLDSRLRFRKTFQSSRLLLSLGKGKFPGDLLGVWDTIMESSDFQWLSPQEAPLHRPDSILGSNEKEESEYEIFTKDGKFATKKITISKIFLKLFDEIITNSSDQSVRDPTLKNIRVSYDGGNISVFNDGEGMPVDLFKGTERYIPDVVFSELSAGSNFEDNGTRTTGGRIREGLLKLQLQNQNTEQEINKHKILSFVNITTKEWCWRLRCERVEYLLQS
jgi:DNA gyrase/topoisomerase IV subunit B